jgi:hypothetical protein
MNCFRKFPLLLLVAGTLCVFLPNKQSSAKYYSNLSDSSCLVKTDASFDFTDAQRKQVVAAIEGKVYEGIEDAGKITWENSPNAPEYYQIILRKGKVSLKYKGTVCQDRVIWQDMEDLKADLKKLLSANKE